MKRRSVSSRRPTNRMKRTPKMAPAPASTANRMAGEREAPPQRPCCADHENDPDGQRAPAHPPSDTRRRVSGSPSRHRPHLHRLTVKGGGNTALIQREATPNTLKPARMGGFQRKSSSGCVLA
jgi:hypothetical protein